MNRWIKSKGGFVLTIPNFNQFDRWLDHILVTVRSTTVAARAAQAVSCITFAAPCDFTWTGSGRRVNIASCGGSVLYSPYLSALISLDFRSLDTHQRSKRIGLVQPSCTSEGHAGKDSTDEDKRLHCVDIKRGEPKTSAGIIREVVEEEKEVDKRLLLNVMYPSFCPIVQGTHWFKSLTTKPMSCYADQCTTVASAPTSPSTGPDLLSVSRHVTGTKANKHISVFWMLIIDRSAPAAYGVH